MRKEETIYSPYIYVCLKISIVERFTRERDTIYYLYIGREILEQTANRIKSVCSWEQDRREGKKGWGTGESVFLV